MSISGTRPTAGERGAVALYLCEGGALMRVLVLILVLVPCPDALLTVL